MIALILYATYNNKMITVTAHLSVNKSQLRNKMWSIILFKVST